MKKQLLSMLLCGSLLAALTGCSGGTTSSAASSGDSLGSSTAVPMKPSAPIQNSEELEKAFVTKKQEEPVKGPVHINEELPVYLL